MESSPAIGGAPLFMMLTQDFLDLHRDQ